MTLGRSEDYPRPFACFSDEQKAAIIAASARVSFEVLYGVTHPLRPYVPDSIKRALAERGDYLRRLEHWICSAPIGEPTPIHWRKPFGA